MRRPLNSGIILVYDRSFHHPHCGGSLHRCRCQRSVTVPRPLRPLQRCSGAAATNGGQGQGQTDSNAPRQSALLQMLLLVSVPVLFIFSLYAAVTFFKLAIPGDYSTPCKVSGRMSVILLFCFQSTALGSLCGGLLLRNLVFSSPWNIVHVILVSVIAAAQVSQLVFFMILAIRSGRIWRGGDVNLYEFFALYIFSAIQVLQ